MYADERESSKWATATAKPTPAPAEPSTKEGNASAAPKAAESPPHAARDEDKRR